MLTLADIRNTKQQALIDATIRRFGGVAPAQGLIEVRRQMRGSDRAVDFAKRTIKGFASRFGSFDSYNDVMARGAFERTIAARFTAFDPPRIKVLLHHDWSSPVGIPIHMEEERDGLFTESRIANTDKGTELLTLADEGVIDGLSLGFYIPKGGAEWIEFSNVDELNALGYGEAPADPAWMPPRLITDTDVIEYTFTSFPAVDEARLEARNDILHTLARTCVRGAKLPKGCQAPRDQQGCAPAEPTKVEDRVSSLERIVSELCAQQAQQETTQDDAVIAALNKMYQGV